MDANKKHLLISASERLQAAATSVDNATKWLALFDRDAFKGTIGEMKQTVEDLETAAERLIDFMVNEV